MRFSEECVWLPGALISRMALGNEDLRILQVWFIAWRLKGLGFKFPRRRWLM